LIGRPDGAADEVGAIYNPDHGQVKNAQINVSGAGLAPDRHPVHGRILCRT
jgi:hypothetical protein